MKNILQTLFIIVVTSFFVSSFTLNHQAQDVVILKLMGKKLESAYIIDKGNELKLSGQTGDESVEYYLKQGYKIHGQSSASDAGRFSVVLTLVK